MDPEGCTAKLEHPITEQVVSSDCKVPEKSTERFIVEGMLGVIGSGDGVSLDAGQDPAPKPNRVKYIDPVNKQCDADNVINCTSRNNTISTSCRYKERSHSIMSGRQEKDKAIPVGCKEESEDMDDKSQAAIPDHQQPSTSSGITGNVTWVIRHVTSSTDEECESKNKKEEDSRPLG